ncbi:MAG TPA: methyltransferase domain-containing protein [Candidatus Acidoferrales bacterium]|nr:methyltransferase domain-containing protein [Candidatus Acidoferrales bacterium]
MLSSEVAGLLRCPHCGSRLRLDAEGAWCAGASCGRRYPLVEGVPVLIDEERSLFRIADFLERRPTFFPEHGRLVRLGLERLPQLGATRASGPNYRRLGALLLEEKPAPRVLVIGGSILGSGMEELANTPGVELVETDVALGPRTALVCDAHDLPFAPGCFDGVVAQAVLEHVADPYRCVDEIRRVLAPGGLVYAETPFMQQAHGGDHDFTRFTRLGHRRLFRGFEEVASGAAGGPGSALAWSYFYFLRSFVRRPWALGAVQTWARLTAFWLKYLDPLLLRNQKALDAAWGFYFLGRRSERVLSDRELLAAYPR